MYILYQTFSWRYQFPAQAYVCYYRWEKCIRDGATQKESSQVNDLGFWITMFYSHSSALTKTHSALEDKGCLLLQWAVSFQGLLVVAELNNMIQNQL